MLSKHCIDTPLDLGSLIRDRRKELGLTQEDVAAGAGVARRTVHAIEHGKKGAHLSIALDLCRSLGIDLFARPR